jgi:hypothetical protein
MDAADTPMRAMAAGLPPGIADRSSHLRGERHASSVSAASSASSHSDQKYRHSPTSSA